MSRSIGILVALLMIVTASRWLPIASAEEGEEAAAAAAVEGWRAPVEARAVANPREATEESLAAGKRVYRAACAKCHGKTGAGDGRVAKLLDVPPADLEVRVPGQSDGEIFWKITEGQLPMPSFAKDLTADMRWDVINYLRVLVPGDTEASEDGEPGASDDAGE